MKTLQQEWESYKKACYPQGCHPRQDTECRQAFMAGCTVAFNKMLEAAESVTEEKGAEIIREFSKEALSWCEEIMKQHEKRN